MPTKEEIRKKHLNKNGLSVNTGSVGERIQKSAFDAMEEYAKQECIEFFKWNTRKVYSYIEYLIKIKPLVNSKEIEDALNIFEGSTIEERYNLYLQSKQNT